MSGERVKGAALLSRPRSVSPLLCCLLTLVPCLPLGCTTLLPLQDAASGDITTSKEYSVKWKGYTEAESTWEAASNILPGAEEEVYAFEQLKLRRKQEAAGLVASKPLLAGGGKQAQPKKRQPVPTHVPSIVAEAALGTQALLDEIGPEGWGDGYNRTRKMGIILAKCYSCTK